MSTFDPITYLALRGITPPGVKFRAEPLRGGYWNQVWRVTGKGGDYVVKRFHSGAGPIRFPNLPASEAEALRVLSGKGIAPDFVAFFPEAETKRPVLIYRFYQGRMWRGDAAAVGALLKRAHELAVKGFRHLALLPEAMLTETRALLAIQSRNPRAEALRAALPPPQMIAPPPRLALVHSDLGPGNLIEGEEGLRIIDWQCPGLGDPAEDLYSFLSPAFQILSECPPLDASACAACLAAYGDGETEGRLAELWPYYSARMLAYCAARIGELAVRDPAASRRYAEAFDAEFELLRAQAQ